MRRAILLMAGLLAFATLTGCGDSGASVERPPGVESGKGPLSSTAPAGAEDAMKKSISHRPKASGKAHRGEVPH